MKYLAKILLLSLLLKISYIVFAFGLYYAKVPHYEEIFKKTDNTFYSRVTGIFHRNDSGWYQHIAEKGYSHMTHESFLERVKKQDQLEHAFFPLFPYLIKTCMQLFHTSFTKAGFWFSLIISTFCWILVFYFIKIYTHNEQLAYLSLLTLIFAPFNYYYSMIYTEALYLSLIMIVLIAILKNKCFIMSLGAALLCLIKINGALLFPVFVLFFIESRQVNLSLNPLKWLKFLKTNPQILGLASMPIATFFWMHQQHLLVGDYFAFSTINQSWQRKSGIFPFLALFSDGSTYTQLASFLWLAIFLFLIYHFRRLKLSFNLMNFTGMFLSLTTGNMTSILRYMSILFPINLQFAWSLKALNNKYFNSILIVLLWSLQLWSFYYWLIRDPFSF